MLPNDAPSYRSHLLPSLAVVVCGSMWGVFWYPLRWLDSFGVGAGWVAIVFNAVCTLVLVPWVFGARPWEKEHRGHMLTGLFLGTAFALYTVSLVLTDVVHAILLFYLTPMWSTLVGLIFLGQRLNFARALSMLLGLGGTAAILGAKNGLPIPHNIGDWLALISGMLWAVGTLRSFLRPAPGVALPVFAFAIGGLVSSSIIVLLSMPAGLPLSNTGNLVQALPWIVLLALIIFVPPNFLVLWAARRIDLSRLGILLMSEVLVGAASAGLFSGEPFGLAEMVGSTMIICAALIEVLGRH